MPLILSSRPCPDLLEELIDFEGLLYRIDGKFFDEHKDTIMGALGEVVGQMRTARERGVRRSNPE